MTVRWRTSAVNDLTRIRDYITEFNPEAAQHVVERVLRSVDRLENFPESGRPGGAARTREIVIPGLPYIVVYTVADTDVDVIAVFHAAQNR